MKPKVKTSDKVIGVIGILQALLLIWYASLVIDIIVELQEDFNDISTEFKETEGCGPDGTDPECDKLVSDMQDWMDMMQDQIVRWQAIYGFAAFVGVAFLLVCFRLLTGTEKLLNSVYTNQNRLLFFHASGFLIVFGMAVGYYEISMMEKMYDELFEIFGVYDYELEDPEFSLWMTNGGLMAIMNCVFLTITGLIGLSTRGPKEQQTEPEVPYTDANKWIKETDDAFGGTAMATDVDPLGHRQELEASFEEAPVEEKKGIEELESDDDEIPEMTTIKCPTCASNMEVPKLGKVQNVTCGACGTSGETEI